MAAFTFYGTSLKGFRSGFGLEQGLSVARRASPECVLVLRRARELGGVLCVRWHRESDPQC
jgi:hypothetical protein